MFRRRRTADPEPVADEAGEPAQPDPQPVPAADRPDGPYDLAEVADPAEGGRVDLGGIWLPGAPGMELRVEVDQQTQAVASITAVLGQAAVQIQPFAAPRTEGIWPELRAEIAAGLRAQGGRAEEATGPFGTELAAQVPVRLPDGSTGLQVARFVGVDGPRWFLRGVFTGAAAVDRAAAAPLEAVLRGVVVVRGGEAMAPREPIPLRLPTPAAAETGLVPLPDEDAPGDPADERREPLRPFERGPEITEVR